MTTRTVLGLCVAVAAVLLTSIVIIYSWRNQVGSREMVLGAPPDWIPRGAERPITDSGDWDAYLHRATMRLIAGDFSGCEGDLKHVLANAEPYRVKAKAHRELGHCFLQQHRHEDARLEIEAALDLLKDKTESKDQKEYWELIVWKANALFYGGRYDESLAECDIVIAERGRNYDVARLKPMNLLKLNRWEEARVFLEDLGADDYDVKAAMMLSIALAKLGHADQAKAMREKAYGLDPSVAPRWEGFGDSAEVPSPVFIEKSQ